MTPQPGIRKGAGYFVVRGKSYFAQRRLRAHLGQPVTLAVLLGVAGVLAIVGPFDTGASLRLAPRFAYWLVTVLATYSTGFVISDLIGTVGTGRLPRPLLVGVTALATGAGVTACVTLINGAALDYWPASADWPALIGTIFPVAVIIAVLIDTLSNHAGRTAATGVQVMPQSPGQPALLDRLPLAKRGPILALSVEDHYVRVRTSKGDETILMRLADAMRETGATPGLQVHRSHWVAIAAVTQAKRTGDTALLTLSHGSDIPVSRRYIPAIKEAGLLPR